MKNIKIINKVDINEDGLVSTIGYENKNHKIFLRQGDMDAACGLYCTFMSLLICGLISRESITGMAFSDDKKIKNLWKEFSDYSPLIKEGTTSKKLSEAINIAFGEKIEFKKKRLQYNKCPQNKKVLDAIKDEILSDNPIIIGVNWSKDSGHWVIVTGIEYTISNNGNYNINKIFILDPLRNEPKLSYWNQMILVSQNQLGYKCVVQDENADYFTKITLDDCILISISN